MNKNEIGSCIRLFADDISRFIIVDDPVSSAERLNADLIKILQWVTLIPYKTESLIIISRKINKPIHPTLYMNIQHVLEVDCQKYLGLFYFEWWLVASSDKLYTGKSLVYI